MALYIILFGISIFMIALVIAIIQKTFSHWKTAHKTESMAIAKKYAVERPTVSMIIYSEKCWIRKKNFPQSAVKYDVINIKEEDMGEEGVSSVVTEINSKSD
ncbi:unnamed protein product [Plutella xylostella]|uniref:(diamondback moth) hypothetical protein n=1 Tax=Plutella xylostella TaxID=51655 RepID=A0A8S4F074_PLUXY|nr:unnamed protein product [Plutella xylostella]